MPDITDYPVRLHVDYSERLDRLTTLLRAIWIIPISVILTLVSTGWSVVFVEETGEVVRQSSDVASGLAVAIALMIIVRRRYPRWWFDFLRELVRFQGRVGAYIALLTDRYPSTVDEQAVHIEIDYPDVERDLNRWLPLVKWLLVLPHVFALLFLGFAAFLAVIVSWFAILITGRYPRPLFDYVVGVWRWGLRVLGYAFLLVTDRYPPFSLL